MFFAVTNTPFTCRWFRYSWRIYRADCFVTTAGVLVACSWLCGTLLYHGSTNQHRRYTARAHGGMGAACERPQDRATIMHHLSLKSAKNLWQRYLQGELLCYRTVGASGRTSLPYVSGRKIVEAQRAPWFFDRGALFCRILRAISPQARVRSALV